MPPPPWRHQDAIWKQATVHVDSHIEVDRHYYSVPHPLVGQRCGVRLTPSLIEVFVDGCRVAVHPRSRQPGGYTTEPDHLPVTYRSPVQWTPGRIITWAAQTGPATAQMAERILARPLHPEQGFRACLGLISLGRRVGRERLECACQQALALGAYRYRSVKALLERDPDRQPAPTPRPPAAPRRGS